MVEAVYAELRRLARGYFARRGQNTLQPTELVHEAFIRLAQNRATPWTDRAHFGAVATLAMRQILTDRARRRTAEKRGGSDRIAVTLGDVDGQDSPILDLLLIDELLNRLETLDARQARVVELRIFGGLTTEEIAAMLEMSVRTIEKDWRFAKAWLSRELALRGAQ